MSQNQKEILISLLIISVQTCLFFVFFQNISTLFPRFSQFWLHFMSYSLLFKTSLMPNKLFLINRFRLNSIFSSRSGLFHRQRFPASDSLTQKRPQAIELQLQSGLWSLTNPKLSMEGIQLRPALPETKTINLCLQQSLKVLQDNLLFKKPMIDDVLLPVVTATAVLRRLSFYMWWVILSVVLANISNHWLLPKRSIVECWFFILISHK